MVEVLVTGGAGFIGGHIVDKLLEKGHKVTVVDCLEEPTHQNGNPNYLSKDVEFINENVLFANRLIPALKRADILFHEAATVGFTENLVRYYNWNTLATAKLWDVIIRERIDIKKFIVASSVAVYGEGKYSCNTCGIVNIDSRCKHQLLKGVWEHQCPGCAKPVIALPTDESTPISPQTHYSQSKYDQERISLLSGKKLGIPVVGLRYFLTYGERQSSTNPYTGVCSIFSRLLRQKTAPLIYEDGLQTRDFVHVTDVVQANMIAMENEEANNRVFNVGTGKPSTILDVAEKLTGLLGVGIQCSGSRKFRVGDVRHSYADINSITSLGYTPLVSLEEGLKRFVAWSGESL